MKRIEITQNCYLYQFDPDPERAYGFNIYCLLNGNQALVIDAGYKKHAEKVSQDLIERGHTIKQVLFSHFHPDHIDGIEAFENVEIFGSEHYAATQEKYSPELSHLFKSTHTLTDGDELSFGGFHLKFHHSPGHSPCSLYIVINEKMVHVADTLLATNQGEPLCPFAPYEDVELHIRSLEQLIELSPDLLLLGHGQPIQGNPLIREEINNRLIYLRAVRDSGGTISFEDATKNCTRKFLNEQWHIQNAPAQP